MRTLADGKRAMFVMATAPANPDAITVTEAAAAVNWSKHILASDFDLGPPGSDSVAEKDLTAKGNASSFGPSNFGGGYSTFREFDLDTGQAAETEDVAYQGSKEKGTILHVIVRETAKDATAALALADEYDYYELLLDDPVRGDRTGFIKYRHNCAVQRSSLHKEIVAAA